jgi:hypothetical protein
LSTISMSGSASRSSAAPADGTFHSTVEIGVQGIVDRVELD